MRYLILVIIVAKILMDMINYMKKSLDKKEINFLDIQPGDVEKTFANIRMQKIN